MARRVRASAGGAWRGSRRAAPHPSRAPQRRPGGGRSLAWRLRRRVRAASRARRVPGAPCVALRRPGEAGRSQKCRAKERSAQARTAQVDGQREVGAGGGRRLGGARATQRARRGGHGAQRRHASERRRERKRLASARRHCRRRARRRSGGAGAQRNADAAGLQSSGHLERRVKLRRAAVPAQNTRWALLHGLWRRSSASGSPASLPSSSWPAARAFRRFAPQSWSAAPPRTTPCTATRAWPPRAGSYCSRTPPAKPVRLPLPHSRHARNAALTVLLLCAEYTDDAATVPQGTQLVVQLIKVRASRCV